MRSDFRSVSELESTVYQCCGLHVVFLVSVGTGVNGISVLWSTRGLFGQCLNWSQRYISAVGHYSVFLVSDGTGVKGILVLWPLRGLFWSVLESRQYISKATVVDV